MRQSVIAATFLLAVASAAQAQTWTIDASHSAAQFAVRHMMVSTVRGDLGKVTGSITFDGKNIGAASVDATIDVTAISTRDEKRDAHLKSPDFFDTATFPTMTFKSTKVVPNADGSFKLMGDLTMRGVTKAVTLDVEALHPVVKMGANLRTGTTATTKLNRKDFGVSWSRVMDGGGVVVSDEVAVTIDLELIQQGAPAK